MLGPIPTLYLPTRVVGVIKGPLVPGFGALWATGTVCVFECVSVCVCL